jgi:hypothetical protein
MAISEAARGHAFRVRANLVFEFQVDAEEIRRKKLSLKK